jgi:hypothetical protein
VHIRTVLTCLFPQPYVTELDLRHSLVPDEIIEELVKSMPPHKGPDLQEDRNVPKYDYITFMSKYMGGSNTGVNGLTTRNYNLHQQGASFG